MEEKKNKTGTEKSDKVKQKQDTPQSHKAYRKKKQIGQSASAAKTDKSGRSTAAQSSAEGGEKTAKLAGIGTAVTENWHQLVAAKLPDDCTEELLNAVAASVRSSKTVTSLVLPQVEDEKLKVALTEETAVYDEFLEKVKNIAKKSKAGISEPNPIGKFISDSGVRFKLFFNSDTTDIAEILITEKTAEVIDLGREVKHLTPVSDESRLIATELLKFHETQIDGMKYYL